MTTRTIVIVGPTAVGKTDLSLDLAQALDAEIVNADSMQLYRGMDIGTAKLPVGQRRGIPHHMLDVLDVTQPASAAAYQEQAREVVAGIHSRGLTAVVVGGSGLFVSALLDDLRFPPQDAGVRARLEQEAAALGPAALHRRLVAADPVAAGRILATNTRRIVRALEVLEVTGAMPVTHLGQLDEVVPSVRIGLRRSRDNLDERIAQRVAHMWQAGLVDEVRALEAEGLREGLTAAKALGYQQVLGALAGESSLDAAQRATVAATRRYVRRQESWFGRDQRITWLDATHPDLCSAALACARAA